MDVDTCINIADGEKKIYIVLMSNADCMWQLPSLQQVIKFKPFDLPVCYQQILNDSLSICEKLWRQPSDGSELTLALPSLLPL